jgi:hypothetical protein
MSVFDENLEVTDPPRQLDLLVDGELGESDRRALLVRLEHEPDGWRRCALAFLESQCWKSGLSEMAISLESTAEEKLHPSATPSASPPQRRQTWRQHLATGLTMAASFLLALSLGMGLRSNWLGVAGHSRDNSSAVAATALTAKPDSSSVSPQATPASGAVEFVDLDVNSPDGKAQTLRFPATRVSDVDEGMLNQIPYAVSPELLRAFEQSGHRVLQKREVVPLRMNDGRRLVVPVDHVQIYPVGRRYQ